MPLLYTGRTAQDKELGPTDEQYDNLLRTISKFKDPDMEIEWGDPILHMKVGDIFGFSQGVEIMANGDVALSPYLPFTFGSLREKSLKQIWEDMRLAWRYDRVANAVSHINTAEDLANVDGIVPWIDEHEEVRDVY
jgi:hypothetical protein